MAHLPKARCFSKQLLSTIVSSPSDALEYAIKYRSQDNDTAELLEREELVEKMQMNEATRFVYEVGRIKGRYLSAELYDKVLEKVERGEGNGRGMNILLKHFGRYGIVPDICIVEKMIQKVIEESRSLQPLDLSSLLVFCSRCREAFPTSHISRRILSEIFPLLGADWFGRYNTIKDITELISLVNSAAILECEIPELWEAVLSRLIILIPRFESKLNYRTVSLILNSSHEVIRTLKPATLNRTQRLWFEATAAFPIRPGYFRKEELSSKAMKRLKEVIQAMELQVISVGLLKNAFAFDLLIRGKINVEVDGPWHYLRSTSGDLLTSLQGYDFIRDRVVETYGIKVQRISSMLVSISPQEELESWIKSLV